MRAAESSNRENRRKTRLRRKSKDLDNKILLSVFIKYLKYLEFIAQTLIVFFLQKYLKILY